MADTPAPCLFCGIVDGSVAASVAYEDAATVAVMNLRQPRAGHVLVVPRRHVETIFDLDDDGGAALMRTTALVARAVRDACRPDGLNLWQSNGAAGGQEVPHVHMQ